MVWLALETIQEWILSGAQFTCGQVDVKICHPRSQHRPSLHPTQPLSNKGLEDYSLPFALNTVDSKGLCRLSGWSGWAKSSDSQRTRVDPRQQAWQPAACLPPGCLWWVPRSDLTPVDTKRPHDGNPKTLVKYTDNQCLIRIIMWQ